MDLEEVEQNYADFYSNVLSDKHYESLAQMNYSQLTEELNRVHAVLAPSTKSEKKQVAAFKRKMRKEWRQMCKQAAEKEPMGSEPVLSEVETPLSGAGVVPILQQQQETIPVIDLTGEVEAEEEEECTIAADQQVPIKEEEEECEVWEEEEEEENEIIDHLLVSQFLLGLSTGAVLGCGLCLFIALFLLLLRGGVVVPPL
jgi:hypothetical protein